MDVLKKCRIGESCEHRKDNSRARTGSFAILRRISAFCRITEGRFDGCIKRHLEPDVASAMARPTRGGLNAALPRVSHPVERCDPVSASRGANALSALSRQTAADC